MIWHTLKIGVELIKSGLFWIYNKGSKALFWLDSWDGNPPILSMYLHLQLLCDIFSVASWHTVAHYNCSKSRARCWLQMEGFL